MCVSLSRIWPIISHYEIKTQNRDFPGGTVVRSPPANAGNMGWIPGLGRSHKPRSNWAREPQLLSLLSGGHVPQLLSPRATTAEACAPRARAPQPEKAPQWEAGTLNKEWPLISATGESPRAATKTQRSQK